MKQLEIKSMTIRTKWYLDKYGWYYISVIYKALYKVFIRYQTLWLCFDWLEMFLHLLYIYIYIFPPRVLETLGHNPFQNNMVHWWKWKCFGRDWFRVKWSDWTGSRSCLKQTSAKSTFAPGRLWQETLFQNWPLKKRVKKTLPPLLSFGVLLWNPRGLNFA